MRDRNEASTGAFDASQLVDPLNDTSARPAAFPCVCTDVAAASHPGLVRPNNEDHYIVARLARAFDVLTTNLPAGELPPRFEEAAYALAVADGMGGASAGEVASALALSMGTRLTLGETNWPLRMEAADAASLIERVARYFREIDRVVSERARSTPALAGMGTTLTVVYTVGVDLFVFHVGDSRAYLLRDAHLTQLTRDQTVAQALADAGQIAPEAVASHDLRHVLTQAIGTESGEAEVDVRRVRVAEGDRLLICTDGLTDLVSHDTVADALARAENADAACRTLVDLALQQGGRDNVTVVAAFFHREG